MKAAIYARVSTERQAERGTIGSQIEALRACVAAAGDELAAEYCDDGHSGALDQQAAERRTHAPGDQQIWRQVLGQTPLLAGVSGEIGRCAKTPANSCTEPEPISPRGGSWGASPKPNGSVRVP